MLRKPASERWWVQRDSNPCSSLERANGSLAQTRLAGSPYTRETAADAALIAVIGTQSSKFAEGH
jgi:hypothetical protein